MFNPIKFGLALVGSLMFTTLSGALSPLPEPPAQPAVLSPFTLKTAPPVLKEFLAAQTGLDALQGKITAIEQQIDNDLPAWEAAELKKVTNPKQEAWETKAEYEARLSPFQEKLTQARETWKAAERQLRLSQQVPDLSSAQDRLRRAEAALAGLPLTSAEWQISVGQFNRQTKVFILTLTHKSPEVPLQMHLPYSLAQAPDMGEAYKAFHEADLKNKLAVQGQFTLRRQGKAGWDLVLTKASLWADSGFLADLVQGQFPILQYAGPDLANPVAVLEKARSEHHQAIAELNLLPVTSDQPGPTFATIGAVTGIIGALALVARSPEPVGLTDAERQARSSATGILMVAGALVGGLAGAVVDGGIYGVWAAANQPTIDKRNALTEIVNQYTTTYGYLIE